MDRKRRTRILIEGPSGLAQKLSEEIEGKYDIKTIEEPNSGLVMLKMRENSKRALFYLGEVIVVEAKRKFSCERSITSFSRISF